MHSQSTTKNIRHVLMNAAKSLVEYVCGEEKKDPSETVPIRTPYAPLVGPEEHHPPEVIHPTLEPLVLEDRTSDCATILASAIHVNKQRDKVLLNRNSILTTVTVVDRERKSTTYNQLAPDITYAITNFNKQILCAFQANNIGCYDYQSSRLTSGFICDSRVTSVTPLPDERYIATGHVGGDVNVWELESGKLVQAFSKHWTTPENEFNTTCVFLLDDDTLASIEHNNRGRIVFAGKGKVSCVEDYFEVTANALTTIPELPGDINAVICKYLGFFRHIPGRGSPVNLPPSPLQASSLSPRARLSICGPG